NPSLPRLQYFQPPLVLRRRDLKSKHHVRSGARLLHKLPIGFLRDGAEHPPPLDGIYADGVNLSPFPIEFNQHRERRPAIGIERSASTRENEKMAVRLPIRIASLLAERRNGRRQTYRDQRKEKRPSLHPVHSFRRSRVEDCDRV